jgi:TolA-binding protein
MRKTLILLVAIAFFAYTAHAKELFLNTNPLNAQVYMGDDLIGKTPLRLSNLRKDGLSAVRFTKKGYEDVEIQIELDEERSQLLYYNLYSPNVDFILSQREKDVFLNEVSAGKSPLVVKNIPNGVYRIESNQERIAISNAEYQRLKKTTRWETISTGVLFAGSLGAGIYYSNSDNQKTADLFLLSTIIFGGLLGYNLLKLGKIELDARMDRAEMSAIEISHMSLEADRDMFTTAMEYVGKEYYEDALSKFKLLVNLYPDSQYVPLGLYQIGTIHYSLEEYEQAARHLKTFVYDYPVIEFFTFAVHDLIDSELKQKNVAEALGYYESLRPVYVDDPSGTLYSMYYDLYTRLYEETGSQNDAILKDLLDEFDYFLDNYQDTYFYPDVMFLKGKLLYSYLDREQGITVFESLRERYGQREEILAQVESLLNAR